ncbi:MAG: DEAD/DEAH box helicase [Bacteroidetes bacterium]|nr:DEAD/DEAH box helicase [Bacteroidota bacterium]
MNTFAEMGLADGLLKAVRELGFETPTPIQDKTIPHLLSSDQDLIAFAQTGTGKTAAFGLPAIQLTNVEDKRTQTLILCPTRELCMQITKDLKSYSKHIKGINIVAVYGGSSIETQIKALNRGAHIVVGTPGRTKDLIKRKKLLPENVERLVLDEADEMLSMGFKEDLNAILANTPQDKQTLLFSATMSKEVMAITKKYMSDPIELSATRMNTVAENVKHFYYMVHAKDRYEVLKRIADINPNIYGIVFCRTRRETKETANKLMQDGYNADTLHGDLSQAQRDEVMGRFRNRQLQLLVATDVAARGLDVTDLTHIINYNLPDDAEIYIHRSGRTGRAGKSGTSVAIVHTRETRKLKEIENKFGIVFTKKPVPGGKDICTKQLYTLIDRIEKVQVDDQQIEPFMSVIYKKLEWLSREELIKHFVSAEFNRFLDYYKNASDINVSEDQRGDKKGKREKRSRDNRGGTSFSRLFINAGTNHNLNPTLLIGLINEALDSGDAEIGKIEILKKFSFFEIEDAVVKKLINALKGQNFEGVSLMVDASKERSGLSSSKRKKSKYKEHEKDTGSKRGEWKKRGGGDRRKRRKW